ncbi:MAG TPA: hypothetical protein VEM93_01680 [Actinomycetota bacterium]|nr:hypothetical protein [Actinomycetota bacterium]
MTTGMVPHGIKKPPREARTLPSLGARKEGRSMVGRLARWWWAVMLAAILVAVGVRVIFIRSDAAAATRKPTVSFGMIGTIPALQTIRLAVTDVAPTGAPVCTMELSFRDARAGVVAEKRVLVGPQRSVMLDLNSASIGSWERGFDPNARNEFRATVRVISPTDPSLCRPMSTVEVFETETGQTRVSILPALRTG